MYQGQIRDMSKQFRILRILMDVRDIIVCSGIFSNVLSNVMEFQHFLQQWCHSNHAMVDKNLYFLHHGAMVDKNLYFLQPWCHGG